MSHLPAGWPGSFAEATWKFYVSDNYSFRPQFPHLHMERMTIPDRDIMRVMPYQFHVQVIRAYMKNLNNIPCTCEHSLLAFSFLFYFFFSFLLYQVQQCFEGCSFLFLSTFMVKLCRTQLCSRILVLEYSYKSTWVGQ